VDLALPREVAAAQELHAKDKKPPIQIENEQEESVFDFVEAHTDLYNKRHADFMETHSKDALWQQLAITI